MNKLSDIEKTKLIQIKSLLERHKTFGDSFYNKIVNEVNEIIDNKEMDTQEFCCYCCATFDPNAEKVNFLGFHYHKHCYEEGLTIVRKAIKKQSSST